MPHNDPPPVRPSEPPPQPTARIATPLNPASDGRAESETPESTLEESGYGYGV